MNLLSDPRIHLRSAIVAAISIAGAFAAAAAMAHPESRAPINIGLKAQVEVARAQVTLGDVVDVSAHDAAELQAVLPLPLGRIPSDGEPVMLDRATLLRWMRVRAGMDTRRISWSGAKASSIRLATTTVGGERFARFAQDQFKSTLNRGDLRVEVIANQVPADVVLPSGSLDLKLRGPNTQRSTPESGASSHSAAESISMLAKHQSVWIDAFVDGRFIRTVPVVLNVSAVGPAYVAKLDLPVGRPIDAKRPRSDEFGIREIEWAGRRSMPMQVTSAAVPSSVDASGQSLLPADASQADASPSRLRRHLHAGEPLSDGDLESAPLVVRGDYASLHAYQGAVQLESRVEVLQDGVEGQLVRVKSSNATGAITARVTGRGQLEVRQ